MTWIEVRSNRDKVVSWGSGVLIDANGSIVTSLPVVQRIVDHPSEYVLTTCASPTATSSAPTCTLHASIVQISKLANLALLRVSEVVTPDFGWISLDEYRLRQGANPGVMSVAFLHTTTTNVFPADLGETVRVFGYGGVGNAKLGFKKMKVSGFETAVVRGSGLKARMNVDAKILPGYAGGAVVDGDGAIIGLASVSSTAAPLGSVTALPLIRSFLADTLGSAYVSSTHVAFPNLDGVFGGSVPKALRCPTFSSLDTSGRVCRCHPGFFAVNNACIVGTVYCKVIGGEYDAYRQTCFNVKVAAPASLVPTVSAFPPITAACKGHFQLGKQCVERNQYCASWRLNGVFNATKEICECKKGKVPDVKTGRCAL